MDLALILPTDGPRGVRLVAALREAILTGRLPPGSSLPASRALAAQLRIARGTVVAAYEELVSEGYCVARVGAGTFVADLTAQPPSNPTDSIEGTGAGRSLSAWGSRLPPPRPSLNGSTPYRYDFRSGVDEQLFPAELIGRALRRATNHLSGGGPGDPNGSIRLRHGLVTTLARARGLRADPSRMVIVSGSQQGLDLASRLLVNPGDVVCVEEPGYARARAVFRALGARLRPVPVDRGGLVTSALPREGARMVYVTPSHQHPTGAVLAPDRRLALLSWANDHGAWVLEDDYDSEFRYGGPPLPCLQGLDTAGRCLYIGSLSKLLHPALRTGYIVAPPDLVSAIIAAKSMLDQTTTPIVQEAMADLYESGEIERHLRRSMRSHRMRRARLLAACEEHLPAEVRIWPVTGGVHAFLEIPGIDAARLFTEAERRGVALIDATDCYEQPPSGAQIILWFSRIATDQIPAGIAALAQAIRVAGSG